MHLRQTHTFAELLVSASTYDEVERLLRAAGYGHVFVDGAIDMTGIALTRDSSAPKAGEPALTPTEQAAIRIARIASSPGDDVLLAIIDRLTGAKTEDPEAG